MKFFSGCFALHRWAYVNPFKNPRTIQFYVVVFFITAIECSCGSIEKHMSSHLLLCSRNFLALLFITAVESTSRSVDKQSM